MQSVGYLYGGLRITLDVARRWTARNLLIVGLPAFAIGFGLFLWEFTSESGIELISLPLLLIGLFLLFEGFVTWRRSRLLSMDNPK